MVNRAILVGRVGRDPELRSTPNGQPVASFSLATDRKWKDKQGQRQESVEWSNLVLFGRQAEIAGQYVTKGMLLYVEGRLQTRSWDDKQSGEKKSRTEIVVENFQMLGGGKERQQESEPEGGGYGDADDDSIPF